MIKNKNFRIHPQIIRRMIFTNRCRLCAKVMPLNVDICDDCSVEKIRVSEESITSHIYTDNYFDALTAPFYYDDPVIKSIHNLKYNGFKRASEFIASEMIEVIERDFKDENPDFITCIPMTKNSRRRRGYNQGELIIRYISKAFGIKMNTKILRKIRKTESQVNLNHKERKRNLKDAFAANKKVDIKGKTILICDDVFTTGSTLDECAKTLKKAGAKRVICAVCAINSYDFRKGANE